jgi:hypothetical protein
VLAIGGVDDLGRGLVAQQGVGVGAVIDGGQALHERDAVLDDAGVGGREQIE